MSETFYCDDKETLVAYLYGEIDPVLTREVERHLESCAACTEEVTSLQAVRQDLESWVPPMPDLGFTIVRQQPQAPAAATVLRPSRWQAFGTMPGWAQAAAAMLVVGVGAGMANLQVRYSNDGLLVTTGWMTPAPAAAAAVVGAAPAREEWRPALVSLEQSLRGELAQIKRTPEPEAVSVRGPETGDNAALLRRMQSMIDASEQRQGQAAGLMLTQFTRDVDMQRRADLMRINQTLGAMQGRAYKTEAGQAEMMNLLRRVSVQPVP